jgi:predicted RNA-binding protein YlqC (UPF0109 family)
MEDTLKIGLIVKPQGIRGELKVQPLTDDINDDGKNVSVTITLVESDMGKVIGRQGKIAKAL